MSVFVDESGDFGYSGSVSRYYVIGLVFHDQRNSIRAAAGDLDLALADLHIADHCFHAGPLIRHEKGYEFLDWSFRRRIFAAMMAFTRKVDFRYACFTVDKHYVSSRMQIVTELERQMQAFFIRHADLAGGFSNLKVYYDCGQSEVTRLLHRTIETAASGYVSFAQSVNPRRYKLLQLADLVCTIKLLEMKLAEGSRMTESEERFFGGPRDFKRNVLKKLKPKEL